MVSPPVGSVEVYIAYHNPESLKPILYGFSVGAVSSVGLGGVGPCVGGGVPEWVVVEVGMGSTSRCG